MGLLADWRQTGGSGALARRLQLHTHEHRTNNQTLVQWSNSAETMAAIFSHATKSMRSASTGCGKASIENIFERTIK